MKNKYKSKNELIEDNNSLSSFTERDKEKLNELLKNSPLNLSTCLIKINQKNNYKPLSIDKYYENAYLEIESLRRTDGSKYKSKSISTVRSAIVSNKLFIKNKNDSYSLNIKECIKYLKSIQYSFENKINNKKKNKLINKKEKINFDNNFLGRKRKSIYDISSNQADKYKYVYDLMDNVLNIYLKDKELNKKIKIYFSKCNNYKEVIENYKNNENIIEGILSMFKYFKPFLKNVLFSVNQLNYFNNLNSKIECFKEALKFQKSFH